LKEKEAHHADPAGVAKDLHFTDDFSEGGTKSVVEFTASRVSVMENDKQVRLGIRRYGKTNVRTVVKYVNILHKPDFFIPIKYIFFFIVEIHFLCIHK
jgi:hypothetical protein